VAACGSLEDDVISTGGADVFDRWDSAFDGLHLLLGYGSVTNDNEEEGKRVIQYARQGSTLIDVWFRTGREIQPSTMAGQHRLDRRSGLVLCVPTILARRARRMITCGAWISGT